MRLASPWRPWMATLATLALAAALACGGEEAPAPEEATPTPEAASEPAPAEGGVEITAAAREEARQIFETRCYTCHGKRGQGDGPGSSGLDPKPRDLTDPEWQASVSDEHIERIVLYGGAAVGRSPAMPANPDLSARPAVVAALVEHVRSLPSAGSGGGEGGAR